VGLDEMGPESAKSVPGRELVVVQQPAAAEASGANAATTAASTPARPVRRATQEVDYGRRGKGDVFGIVLPIKTKGAGTEYTVADT
jgi:hypothetical protein